MCRFYDNSTILCNGLGHLEMRALSGWGVLEYLLWTALYLFVCLRVSSMFQARDVAQLVEFLPI